MRRILRSRITLWVLAAVALVVALAVLLHAIGGGDGLSFVKASLGDWAYLAVFLLIVGDAVVPIFPGETTLNAASTLASQGQLELGLVILAGAAGAIVGDSSLYWIARGGSKRVQPQLDRAKQNEKVVSALDFIGDSAPLLIVGGRYVPGLRFAVNATMGLSAYPYRRFLLWSSLGGTLWSVYTCLLAYAVATALSDFPLASVVISGLITTAAILGIFFVVRKRRRQAATPAPEASADPST